MHEQKVILRFPAENVEQPVICDLIRNSSVVLNILQARVNPDEEGMMMISLRGTHSELKKSYDFLQNRGVSVERKKHGVNWDETACVHCGACVGHCPTGALSMEKEGYKMVFKPEKCIVCELCVPVCPYRAIESAT